MTCRAGGRARVCPADRADTAASRSPCSPGRPNARSTRNPSATPSSPAAGSPSRNSADRRRPDQPGPGARAAAAVIAADRSSSALPIAIVPGAKIFALSAAYAAIVPCQSRWCAATFRTVAANGATVELQCSWKLDSSTATTS